MRGPGTLAQAKVWERIDMSLLENWLHHHSSDLVTQMQKTIDRDTVSDARLGLNIASRESLYNVLDQLLAVLFPGVLGDETVQDKGIHRFIEDHLISLMPTLSAQIVRILNFVCEKKGQSGARNVRKSEQAVIHLVESLPAIRKRWMN